MERALSTPSVPQSWGTGRLSVQEWPSAVQGQGSPPVLVPSIFVSVFSCLRTLQGCKTVCLFVFWKHTQLFSASQATALEQDEGSGPWPSCILGGGPGACPLFGFLSPTLVLTKGALARISSIPRCFFFSSGESDERVDVNHASHPPGRR